MAKKSKIVREQKLIRSVKKYASLRAELKDIIKARTPLLIKRRPLLQIG